MRITESRVRQQQFFLFEDVLGEFCRPHCQKEVTTAFVSGIIMVNSRNRRFAAAYRLRSFLDERMTVDRDVSHKTHDAGSTVPAAWKLEEIMIFVNETRGAFTFQEIFVVDQINEKRDVSFYAADPELMQRPVHTTRRFFKAGSKGSNFHEHGVVVRSNESAGECGAGVKTEAHAAC